MVWALGLADALRGAGVPVVEVPGWQSRGVLDRRGRPQPLAAIRGGVLHHTATPATARGDYPSLGVVRDGRSGLPGPLSQCGVGRSGTWYVIAAGLANHAGTVHAWCKSTHANEYAIGVEAEHPGGDHPWPSQQYESYVRGCAALATTYGITWYGHREVAAPTGRKSDPTFSCATFRAQVSTADARSAVMTTLDDIRADLVALRDGYIRVPGQGYGYPLATHNAVGELIDLSNRMLGEVQTLREQVRQLSAPDAEVLAAALAPAIAAAVAPLLTALPDADIDRIRDASVEAHELVVGVLDQGGIIRHQRAAQR